MQTELLFDRRHVIARGGLATIYFGTLMRGAEMGPLLAVKEALGPAGVPMLEDEAAATRDLEHPHLVRVHRLHGTEEGVVLLMVYEHAPSARSLLYKGPLPWPLVVHIGHQAARGLAAMHGRDILHRDISDQNMLVARTGATKICDFNTAKIKGDIYDLTRGDLVKGRPFYMPPEQLLRQPLDPRSDLYALGVTLYRILTNQHPYRATTEMELYREVLGNGGPDLELVFPGDIPGALLELVEQLLCPVAMERPASAFEVAKRLDALSKRSGPTDIPALLAGLPTPYLELDRRRDRFLSFVNNMIARRILTMRPNSAAPPPLPDMGANTSRGPQLHELETEIKEMPTLGSPPPSHTTGSKVNALAPNTRTSPPEPVADMRHHRQCRDEPKSEDQTRLYKVLALVATMLALVMAVASGLRSRASGPSTMVTPGEPTRPVTKQPNREDRAAAPDRDDQPAGELAEVAPSQGPVEIPKTSTFAGLTVAPMGQKSPHSTVQHRSLGQRRMHRPPQHAVRRRSWRPMLQPRPVPRPVEPEPPSSRGPSPEEEYAAAAGRLKKLSPDLATERKAGGYITPHGSKGIKARIKVYDKIWDIYQHSKVLPPRSLVMKALYSSRILRKRLQGTDFSAVNDKYGNKLDTCRNNLFFLDEKLAQ